MSMIDVNALAEGGLNVPVTDIPNFATFVPSSQEGASRYRHTLNGGEHLDALLVNRGSDVLVVSLHGALDRSKTTLPRFERLRTITDTYPVSSMYFSDPALWKSEGLQLAWFTGWEDFDLPQVIATWTVIAAKAVGATRIIFSGSSGGGFASLMVAPLVPGSLAVPFNPQTSIFGYLADNHMWGPQETYRDTVWTQLATGDDTHRYMDWTIPGGERLSPLRRYSRSIDNHVFYVTNTNEFHHEKHFLPFLGAAVTGGNLNKIKWREYAGGTRHNPPPPNVFHQFMREALDCVAALPPVVMAT